MTVNIDIVAEWKLGVLLLNWLACKAMVLFAESNDVFSCCVSISQNFPFTNAFDFFEVLKNNTFIN